MGGSNGPPIPLLRIIMPKQSDIVCVAIAKDEAANLPAFVSTIRPAVDRIVICDTGSTDDTCDVARSLGCEVHQIGWNDDYAEARNIAAQKALPARWLFMPDADMTLVGAEKLRYGLTHAPKDAFLATIRVNLSDSWCYQHRIWRWGYCVWTYRIHEVLRPYNPNARAGCIDGTALEHRHKAGTRGDRRKRVEILRKMVAEVPTNLHHTWNLALELEQTGSIEEAAKWYAKYAWMVDADKDGPQRHKYWCDLKATGLVASGKCYLSLGRRDEALAQFRKAAQAAPLSRYGWAMLAVHGNDRRAALEALRCKPFEKVQQVSEPFTPEFEAKLRAML
jgi:glycosyltransferase involved in cell wall biosynthesis